jgi:hypothetical protein
MCEEAVEHIELAKKWSIDDYQIKVEKRKLRRIIKEK